MSRFMTRLKEDEEFTRARNRLKKAYREQNSPEEILRVEREFTEVFFRLKESDDH